jgi:hypothetical protein
VSLFRLLTPVPLEAEPALGEDAQLISGSCGIVVIVAVVVIVIVAL